MSHDRSKDLAARASKSKLQPKLAIQGPEVGACAFAARSWWLDTFYMFAYCGIEWLKSKST